MYGFIDVRLIWLWYFIVHCLIWWWSGSMEAIEELEKLGDAMRQAAALLADEDVNEAAASSKRPSTFLNVVALGNTVSFLCHYDIICVLFLHILWPVLVWCYSSVDAMPHRLGNFGSITYLFFYEWIFGYLMEIFFVVFALPCSWNQQLYC